MLVRKSILAALLAASAAIAATGNVRADHVEERQPLHAVRGPVEVITPNAILLNRARVLTRLDRAMSELDQLALLVREVPHAPHRYPAYGREQVQVSFGTHGARRGPSIDAAAIRARADQLRNELVALRRMAERAPAAPVVEPVVVTIAPRDLAAFLRDLGRARFSSDKLALVRQLAARVSVTSAQAEQIVAAVPYWVQADAAMLLYDATVDRARFDGMYSVLRYEGDRDRLRRHLARRPR